MRQINATAKADHGRKVHIHGFPASSGIVAVVLQLGASERPRVRGALDCLPAYMTRAEARKLHRALGRILAAKAVRT